MNLVASEVKMLKQLLQICFEDKIDMYLDDIKTFNSLRHRVAAKNPLKNDESNPVVVHNRELEVQKKALKSNARKFWNRRNRHKNKQQFQKGKDHND